MSTEFNKNNNKYFRAKERVAELKKFYRHFTSYLLVIIGLAALNYWTDGWRNLWFLWVAFGWGIGVLSHAVGTFNLNPFFGKNWEKRKIQEFMDKQNKKQKWN